MELDQAPKDIRAGGDWKLWTETVGWLCWKMLKGSWINMAWTWP